MLSSGTATMIDDTTTIYDFATGADVTCSDSSMGNGKTRQVFRQAMQEGELLTTSMGGTFVVDSKFDFNDFSSWEMEFTLTMKGKVFYARPRFCTDNGAMIAYAGCQRLLAGQHEDLAIKVQARWPMESLPAI